MLCCRATKAIEPVAVEDVVEDVEDAVVAVNVAVADAELQTVEISLCDAESLRLQLYDVERLFGVTKLQLIKKQEECTFLSDRLKKLVLENQLLRSRVRGTVLGSINESIANTTSQG
jgi:hypothetical protein